MDNKIERWEMKIEHDTVQSWNTNQARSDSDFGVKFSTIQFYAIEHNFKSNRWIELKLYQKIPKVFVYVGVHFQENPCSEKTSNIGSNELYEFCYLLPFDLWTFYLARILFLQECGSLFWEFSSSTRIFNELQYNLQVWQGFINVSESFPYKDSLLILATQGKKSWWYLMTS
jgi:hypothetical protein